VNGSPGVCFGTALHGTWLVPLTPNRVRRNYRGGAGLARFEGSDSGVDSDRPEDWIASTTEARNPGLEPIPGEGLSMVELGGAMLPLADLFRSDPAAYLGESHVRKHGLSTGFLAKLLDSSMRLHVQAHPTREFARQHLGSRWGKLEAYYVLAVRPGVRPYIRLGFQHPPSRNEWNRIVLEQDIAAMDRCFEPIAVAPGEAWYVPGGLPHAIGEGLTVLEVMEPTDLVVRCEFDRDGIVVPPQARFMGRDPEFALRIFDLQRHSPEEIWRLYHVTPTLVSRTDALVEEQLIGPAQTDCFELRRLRVSGDARLAPDGRFRVFVVVNGTGTVAELSGSVPLRIGSRFFQAAAAGELRFTPAEGQTLDLLCVQAGAGAP